jgi:hypothetical protein
MSFVAPHQQAGAMQISRLSALSEVRIHELRPAAPAALRTMKQMLRADLRIRMPRSGRNRAAIGQKAPAIIAGKSYTGPPLAEPHRRPSFRKI